ncbi:MAG: hypothetical protein JNK83_13280 [Rhizobiales bacterium]|nr:hypothetical protein [Hyphomicrobiales bacterium]
MKISEIVSTEPEDKALAGLEVQKASLKLRQVQNKDKPKPPKPSKPPRPKGSIPSRPPLRPIGKRRVKKKSATKPIISEET